MAGYLAMRIEVDGCSYWCITTYIHRKSLVYRTIRYTRYC